jgi:CheY-like chemotaxis protein
MDESVEIWHNASCTTTDRLCKRRQHTRFRLMRLRKILLVEDDADSLQVLQLLLNLWGYEVITASNGREALKSVSSTKPHLVVTDITMPDMDGVELCRRVKADPDLRGVPIIVTTALSWPTSELEGLVEVIFQKPLDFESLRRAVACRLLNP